MLYHYSPKEDLIIQQYYPKVSMEQLLRMLPNRSVRSIQIRAHRLHVTRESQLLKPVEGEQFDPYTVSLYHKFCEYIAIAIDRSEQSGMKPNIERMMSTFRNVYGRNPNLQQEELAERYVK